MRSYPNNPELVHLNFDVALPEFIEDNMRTISSISIRNYSGTFTYFMDHNKKNPLKFDINIKYSSEFTSGPILSLNLNLTKMELRFDSFYFTVTSFEAKLEAFYNLSEEEKSKIKMVSDSSKQGADAAQAAMVFQNIMTLGSTIAMKSLMLMDFIRLLRFIDVE